MANCTCENWTLEDLASALQNMHKDKKKIAVPMFQRGKRWNTNQQKTFIDSLIKGYPVGTMLFYETIDEGQQTYILVDGLQRGNSIKKYMNNPTEFFYDSSISDDFCKGILELVSTEPNEENCKSVRDLLTGFIKAQKTFKNLQYFTPAKGIVDMFSKEFSCVEGLITLIAKFFDDRQALYEQIALTVIPVIVYHGAEENLPEIFDRINSQGTPLDQYEVFAAAWPVSKRFKVKNEKIIESAIKKYDSFVEDGYIIHGYDREKMRLKKEVNAFEYLFGLSKYLVSVYDMLGFQKNLPDDTVNPLGFELVNACLNDADRIKNLYENIYAITNIDKFEKALCDTVKFVIDAVSPFVRFKGNAHADSKKLFHSKYQILSMISTTFKLRYAVNNYDSFLPEWNSQKDILVKNLRAYYVYDIITNYWSEGGTGKIHSASKTNRYLQEISPRAWRIALDGFFEKSMFRSEERQIPNPKNEEYVLLNSIYLNSFSAMDQLSIDKFDVEHIAPKEQMKKLIAKCKGKGLPISCIANLCYLPEYVNRSKKDKNFYQDTTYLAHIDLASVEQKYSFTVNEDLEWMDMPYETEADFDALKQFYTDFCISRFEKIKKLFCEAMGINYDEMRSVVEEIKTDTENAASVATNKTSDTMAFSNECVKSVEGYIGETLEKIGRTTYKTKDNSKGYVFTSSKAYKQGQRQKYWYAYRKGQIEDISNCTEKYVVYGCKDSGNVLVIPVEVLEQNLYRLNYSQEDDGTISHWHIVLFRDNGGHMTQLFSKPDLSEESVNQYIIK